MRKQEVYKKLLMAAESYYISFAEMLKHGDV